jgi:hypothetical protein
MRHVFISPIIGGLVAIIVVGLWTHNGGTRSAAASSSCQVATSSSGSVSPMLVGAMIRRCIHC